MNQNKLLHNPSVRWLSIAGLLMASALVASARPYASSITNSGTSISFRLNQSADSVKIISSGGAVTNDLGPLPKGLTVTNLTIAGVFKIQVTKSAGPGYIQGVVNQISDDADNSVKFANQRGLAVNKNTNSPYFGRIYVSVGAGGTSGGRSVTDGIYLLNADQTDAVGQGDVGLNGGINDGLGFDALGLSAESPGRLFIGPDDNLYISDWSDANGGLSMTGPNVAADATTTNVLFGLGGPTAVTNMHGSVSSAYVEGSLAAGTLVVYTQDEDLGSRNGVYRYDIGAGPLPYGQPETLAFTYGLGAQVTKITRGPDGKWYCSNRRAEFATTAGIFVLSEDGSTVLWDSINAWRAINGNPNRDVYFGETRGFDVSADGKYLAAIRAQPSLNDPPLNFPANSVCIVRMTDGIPDLTTAVTMSTPGTVIIGRELTFDAVGNIYTVSSGQGLLRIYSPGGFSVVTTGSDGTLEMSVPQVDVSVAATDNLASELNADTGEYAITRATTDFSEPLTVRFTTTGTATNGVDYVLKTNGVTLTTNAVVIPANETTVAITLEASTDALAEFTETANLVITPSAGFTVIGQPATINIEDGNDPAIDIAATLGTVYEGNALDYARFQLTRRGRINDGPLTVELNNSGDTARYLPVASVNVDPGVVNQAFDVSPVNDTMLLGDGTITLTVTAGTGYTVGTTSPSANATIVEDEVGPEDILFADDFSGDPSTNWMIRFGSGNGVDDYRINEQILVLPTTPYDYSFDGIPPAPNSVDTLGLKVTVNKDEGSLAGAAGINLYAVGKNFSGNYALRFDMYLLVNSGAGTTENMMFGINHSGNQTNWFRDSGNGFTNSAYDGLWCVIGADGAGLGQFNGGAGSGDYMLLGGGAPIQVGGIWGPASLATRDASAFEAIFKNPPWGSTANTGPGVPSNLQGSFTPSWAQVELSQVGSLVTLKINNSTILTHTNLSGDTSGTIMLGYDDGFDSNTGVGAAVVYDNVRVVRLSSPEQPVITGAKVMGGDMVITFTLSQDEPATAFAILRSGTVNGTYGMVTANIIKTGPGEYQATVAQSGDASFYRVAR